MRWTTWASRNCCKTLGHTVWDCLTYTRAVYAAVQGRRLLVLDVFVKKTQATPRSAIETARRRLEAMP